MSKDDKVTAKMHRMPQLGEKAPSFRAQTTKGMVDFPKDYAGRWVVLFSHPADFTPVCTSEVASFAALYEDFAALNAELLGLSVDSVSAHLAWVKNIEDKISFGAYRGQKIDFPIIADMKMDVAKKYGMIQNASSDTKAVRAVFIIDPQGKVRTILYYPLSTGRNFAEIKRILEALQISDEYQVATPADWVPGAAVLESAPLNLSEMSERRAKLGDPECQDWFFCTKELPPH